MVNSILEMRAEVNMLHSYSLELSIAPSFPKAGTPFDLEFASCLAMLLMCIKKAKLYSGKALTPKTDT